MPFNRICLNNENVKHEGVVSDGAIDVDTYPFTVKLLDIEKMNDKDVLLLKVNGYDCDVLEIKAPRVYLSITKTTVTTPQS